MCLLLAAPASWTGTAQAVETAALHAPVAETRPAPAVMKQDSSSNSKSHAVQLVAIVFLGLLLLFWRAPLLVPEHIDDPGSKLERELADADSKFVNVLGYELHYKEVGQGDRVFLLFHGFATNLLSWRRVLQPLARLGRVITFDRLGMGLSAHPVRGQWSRAAKSPYAPSMAPDFAIGLMDKLGIAKAILIGHSAGGSVVLRTALKHPARVEALVVVDADWLSTGIMPQGNCHWLWDTLQMHHLGAWAFNKLFSFSNARMLIKLGYHDISKFPVEELAMLEKYYQVHNVGVALWEYAAANEKKLLPATVKNIKVPTLLIAGDDDRVVPTQDQVKLAKEIASSKLAIIKDCGHLPQEEQPEAFLHEVERFVQQLPVR